MACNVHVSCVNQEADLLSGGVDGTYQLAGCFHGKPQYRRTEVPGEERSLFFNSIMGDWEISIGPDPDEDQLLVYGDYGAVSPLDVTRFHLAGSFSSLHRQQMESDVSHCERRAGSGTEKGESTHAHAHTQRLNTSHLPLALSPGAPQDEDMYFVLRAATVTCEGDPVPSCTREESTCSSIRYDYDEQEEEEEEEDGGESEYS